MTTCSKCINSPNEFCTACFRLLQEEKGIKMCNVKTCRSVISSEEKKCPNCIVLYQMKYEKTKEMKKATLLKRKLETPENFCHGENCVNQTGVHKNFCKDCFKYVSEKENFKLCVNYIRSCRSKLPKDYKNKQCFDCLHEYNTKYKKARYDELQKKTQLVVTDFEKVCSNKNCSFVGSIAKHFFNESIQKETSQCKNCREKKRKSKLNAKK